MNLRVKGFWQQSLLAIAVLFFWSCEDETSLLGYRNPNQKFKVNYVEIPLPASTLQIDSLRSSILNTAFYGFTDYPRVLAGKLADPIFGSSKATAYFRFAPVTSTKIKAPAILDSVAFEMLLDYYHYGAKAKQAQHFSVHELLEPIDYSGSNDYYVSSSLDYNSTPLGEGSVIAQAAVFDTARITKYRTILRMPMTQEFGNRIFEVAKNNPGGALDTLSVFWSTFKGLVLVSSETNDRMLGFASSSSYSRITLYYHEDVTKPLQYTLTFGTAAGFTSVQTDRAGTSLDGLQSYVPEVIDNKTYIQAGTGVITALDLSGFYDFAAADSNQNVLFNNVEMVIGSVETPGNYAPPSTLSLGLLNDNYKFYIPQNASDSLDVIAFKGTLNRFDLYAYSGLSDGGLATGTLKYSSTENKYNAMYTLLFQQLYTLRASKQYKKFGLLPYSVKPLVSNADNSYETAKSFNRTVFPASGVKLRIYYTRPTNLN